MVKIKKRSSRVSFLIPVCAWCKKIRDDKGNWSRGEARLREHSGEDLTHGICPECLEKKMAPMRYYEGGV